MTRKFRIRLDAVNAIKLAMLALITVALVLVLVLALTATSASATTVTPTGTIVGQVEKAWLKAGGSAALGDPIGRETKIRVTGRNTYHQHTTRGATVYWDGSQGGKVWLSGKVPSLSGVSAERDALAASGLKPGVVYRSAKLCESSTGADRLLTSMLHGGLIVDLRSSSTASGCPDPSLPTVSRVRYSLTGTTKLETFVTKADDRRDLGKALRAIAREDGPVLIHCTRGRDRTGWAVSVLLMLGGVPKDLVEAEYLRTASDVGKLHDAVTAMYDRYDGVEGYLLDGLGLNPSEVAALQERIS